MNFTCPQRQEPVIGSIIASSAFTWSPNYLTTVRLWRDGGILKY